MSICERRQRNLSYFVFILMFGCLLNLSKCECSTSNINCTCQIITQNFFKCRNPFPDVTLCCSFENGTGQPVQALQVIEWDLSGSNAPRFDFRSLEEFPNLQRLNLSSSNFTEILWENCTSMNALTSLDISFLNFTLSREFFSCFPSLSELNMEGKSWDCRMIYWFIDWVRNAKKHGLNVINEEKVQCQYLTSPTEKYDALWPIINKCPSNCSCQIMREDLLTVDCSGRGFWDFPSELPSNTKIVHLENNRINSFRRIAAPPNIYRSIYNLYLDNNSISSLDELEGVQIRVGNLQLSGNHLSRLPVRILDQLPGLHSIKLGGNPWECDCESGTNLLNYLIRNHVKIADRDNITCSASIERHAGKVVASLTTTDLCVDDAKGIYIIDVVNVFLGLFIIVMLFKISYDWWVFKRTGNLPLGPTFIADIFKRRCK